MPVIFASIAMGVIGLLGARGGLGPYGILLILAAYLTGCFYGAFYLASHG